jgi:hypothetical protein
MFFPVNLSYPASLVGIIMRAAATKKFAAEIGSQRRLNQLEAKAMKDTVGLETLVMELEGRVARLRASEQGLAELDTTEFPAEVEALRALLRDPPPRHVGACLLPTYRTVLCLVSYARVVK